MNYGIIAGVLVTISLLLLAFEGSPTGRDAKRSLTFAVPYGLGVFCWLVLGVLMNQVSLVIISALQIFSLFIYLSRTPS
jgi:uncharacterized protein with PQ loop repeat